MEKGKIRRLENISDDLKKIQDFFIEEAENKTEFYLSRYRSHISSLNGRYICSDLFKETFDIYTESLESRSKYSSVIHNSAAVLANEMFHINAKDPKIKKCIFLSGVPGAGKSFFVQSLALEGMIDDETMIYEGDVTTPTIMEKIETIRDNGKDISIIVINPTLELAQRNAINRSYEIGRGASSETMARIISKLPNALKAIHEKYPLINLAIYNKKTNYDIDYTLGWDFLDTLYQGNYEDTLQRLSELRIQILEEIKNDLKKKSEYLILGQTEGVNNEKRGL